ncbi:hypothetical protein MJO28_005065 [Puccinia striiformis f. sp. tritici]|uniref:Uncharacterized protein n=1 Tax=Puccinia striiformis f. sp. tritici TaxID=168172 RepID=A0ACC0EJT5_9BASI|nr:hypothetical protein MJO28_005065 [Puccinia striiformis f. sp. tritici]
MRLTLCVSLFAPVALVLAENESPGFFCFRGSNWPRGVCIPNGDSSKSTFAKPKPPNPSAYQSCTDGLSFCCVASVDRYVAHHVCNFFDALSNKYLDFFQY